MRVIFMTLNRRIRVTEGQGRALVAQSTGTRWKTIQEPPGGRRAAIRHACNWARNLDAKHLDYLRDSDQPAFGSWE